MKLRVQSLGSTEADLSSEQGSILVEALTALAILTLAMTTLTSGGIAGISRTNQLAVRLTAEAEARAMLARIGGEYPLAVGDWTGAGRSGWTWRRLIKPAAEPNLPRSRAGRELYQVEVEMWQNDNKADGIVLRTLMQPRRPI